MKKYWRISFCAVLLLAVSLFALDGKNFAFNATTNKHPLQYEIDEPMVFTFIVDLKGQELEAPLTIEWSRAGDDGLEESGKILYDRSSPATVTTKLNCNGFVHLYAQLKQADGTTLKNKEGMDWFFNGGAAVHPELLTSTPEPEDFDEFWAKQKARLEKVPMVVDLTEVRKSEYATIYVVRILCAGPRPATGVLTIPVGAEEGKKYPIRFDLHGYGYGGPSFGKINGKGTDEYINFILNAHGVEYLRDDTYYEAFGASIKQNGNKYAFDKTTNSDPETCYFNGMALRLMRALQYVKTLDAWNGKDLHAIGESQGGLQTIWATALDPDVTQATAIVPWCCDIGGHENYNRLNSHFRPEHTRALDYYDCINMVKRIRCPIEIVRAGLGDYACPPSGIAVMYNNLKCKKSIVWYQGSEHSYVPENCEIFRFEE